MTREWERWFAWFPVEVDAYKDSEIKNGKFRYSVFMCWVERRKRPDDDYDEEYDGPRTEIQYRLPQR